MHFHIASEKTEILDLTGTWRSRLYSLPFFKNSVLVDLSSGQGDLGGKAEAYFVWVFDGSTEICIISKFCNNRVSRGELFAKCKSLCSGWLRAADMCTVLGTLLTV